MTRSATAKADRLCWLLSISSRLTANRSRFGIVFSASSFVFSFSCQVVVMEDEAVLPAGKSFPLLFEVLAKCPLLEVLDMCFFHDDSKVLNQPAVYNVCSCCCACVALLIYMKQFLVGATKLKKLHLRLDGMLQRTEFVRGLGRGIAQSASLEQVLT
jgi:hypothetical protein